MTDCQIRLIHPIYGFGLLIIFVAVACVDNSELLSSHEAELLFVPPFQNTFRTIILPTIYEVRAKV